jgi:glycosyltransferase involved in cell wall biosynthesis
MPRLLRITTVPISLHLLLQGQFKYMREHGFDVVTISADGKETEEVIKDGTKHIAIPFTRKITPFQDLICLLRLINTINVIKPDIVHTHTPKAGLLGMLASWFCRIPVRLHTVAGLPLMESKGIKRHILEIAEKITYACAHKVYPNSKGLQQFMLNDLGVRNEKMKIIGKGSTNGIDTAYFFRSSDITTRAKKIRETHEIRDGDIVFSFVGRIVGDKGIVELVQAFKSMVEDVKVKGNDTSGGRNYFLLLVGDFEKHLDPLPEEIMKFLKEDKKVILAGFQKDIRPWIVASDVFVFPSYREGFPNVVMQAALLGIPCIVSDINGCNEIVEHRRTGLVVPVKDVGALVNAMREMVMGEDKRREFADAARDFVEMNFKREVIWEELRREYEGMLDPLAGATRLGGSP